MLVSRKIQHAAELGYLRTIRSLPARAVIRRTFSAICRLRSVRVRPESDPQKGRLITNRWVSVKFGKRRFLPSADVRLPGVGQDERGV